MAEQPTPQERLHQTLFSSQGIVDSLVGPLVFLIAYRLAGLNAALIAALAVALALVAFRRYQGLDPTTAWYGVGGVAIGAALSKATGNSDGFFLPKIVSNAAYGLACVVSVVIGKPLVGLGWAFFHRQPVEWGIRPEVRRVFSALTLMWAGGFFLRAVTYGVLIADDNDRTGSLATVSIVLGLPLTGLLLGVTLLTISRSPAVQPPVAQEDQEPEVPLGGVAPPAGADEVDPAIPVTSGDVPPAKPRL